MIDLSNYVSLNEILTKEELENKILILRIIAIYDAVEMSKSDIEKCATIFTVKINKLYGIKKRIDLALWFINHPIYKKLKEANWKPYLYCSGTSPTTKAERRVW